MRKRQAKDQNFPTRNAAKENKAFAINHWIARTLDFSLDNTSI